MASSLGVASGIDLESLVQSLMISERQPLNRLQTKQKAVSDQISAFGRIQSAMSALSTAMKNLTPTALNGTKAKASDETFLVAKTTGNAALGSMSVEVSRVASFSKIGINLGTLAGDPLNYQNAIKGTSGGGVGFAEGTLQFDFAAGGPSSFTVNVADGASLADIRDSINNSDGTVSATIVTGVNGAELILTSKESGAKFDFDVTGTTTATGVPAERKLEVFTFSSNRTQDVTTGDTIYTDSSTARAHRIDTTGGVAVPASSDRGPQDALLKVDGVQIRSASNSVTNAVSGLTLELKKVTTSSIQVTITQDTADAEKMMNEFIKSYNALIDVVNDVAKNTPQDPGADPEKRTGGPLRSNSTVRSVVAQLQNAILSPLEGSTSTFNSFISLGVKLGDGGKLSLDSEAFKKALGEAPQAIEELFSRQVGGVGTIGLGQRVENLIKTMTDKNEGIVGLELEALNSQTKRLQMDQDGLNRRLEAIEKNYRRQFSGLDMLVGSLKSQGDYLMQQLSRM